MITAIIRYNAGNIRSVTNALNRLGVEPVITDDPDELLKADRVIFPGVGNAGSALSSIRENGLINLIPRLKQPVLAICVGMQLLGEYLEEADEEGMGILAGTVRRFPPSAKVPHTGWNSVHSLRDPCFDGIKEESYLYFVHSYYLPVGEQTVGICDYSIPFSAAMRQDNFLALQFHPEKSGTIGQDILSNFLFKGESYA